jgi:putative endonuclease
MNLQSELSRARGRALEWSAALWLIAKGYRILARNFHAKGGEIDIIALSPGRWAGKPILCFIEVRSRESFEAAAESVHEVKQSRLRRAASAYLSRHRQWSGLPVRFDLVAGMRSGWLQHKRHIFDL